MKKCKTIHYGRNNEGYQYTLNFEDIETASEEKDLGVTFQQDLKFSGHIAEKVNKANSVLSLIVRTFDYIEKESFILLYKALIRPVVEYGNAIWHPFLRKYIESVEKVQKRATNRDLEDARFGVNLASLDEKTCARTHNSAKR